MPLNRRQDDHDPAEQLPDQVNHRAAVTRRMKAAGDGN
jgi:hypothetical protein